MREIAMDTPWMAVAGYFVAERLAEVPGAASDPRISEMYRLVTGTARSDDVPWCAAFVGACLELSGYAPTSSLLASSYKTFGEKLSAPMPGCVIVLKPQTAGASGHVGFFVSMTNGRVRLLGGNQSDAAKEQNYAADDIVAMRWPVKTAPLPGSTSLPTILDIAPDQAPPHLSGSPDVSDPLDWPELEPVPADPTIGMGARGANVEALQTQLTKLNYHLGATDGIFGPLTFAAVLAFQAENGLPATGQVGSAEWAKLAAATARPLGPQRNGADLDKVRETGSRTVATADWLRKVGIGTGLLGALGFTDRQTDIVERMVGGLKVATGVASPSQLVDNAIRLQREVEATLQEGLKGVNNIAPNVLNQTSEKLVALVQKTVLPLQSGDANLAPTKLFELQSEIRSLLGRDLPAAATQIPKLTFELMDKLAPLAKPISMVPGPAGTAPSPGLVGPLLDLIPALIGGQGSATWLLVALGGFLAYRSGGQINEYRLQDYRNAANLGR